jgi:C-terminal processing protease CtpA/Prc
LPKAPQGTYGIGLSQIDPLQPRGGLFICALQPNGVAAKDGRLQIDDQLLCINDQNTSLMTYREVIEALKATTKKGVSLLISRYFFFIRISPLKMSIFIQFRPITDSSAVNKVDIVLDKEIPTVN